MTRTRKKNESRGYHRLPRTLGAREIYVFATRHGILFVVVLAGMLAGSVNYNNNLGFLLTFLLGSVAFVSIFHTHRNLAGIEILSVSAIPVYAGQTAVFEIKAAVSGTSRPAVSWRFQGGGKTFSRLSPENANIVRIGLPAVERGVLRPGRLTVETHFPLGLFRGWFHLRTDARCLVYPRPIPTPFALSSLARGDKDREHDREAGAEGFQGLRIYQPGDSLKHIAWKAYSRGQGLLTKVFDTPGGSGVFLDWDALKETDPEMKLSFLCHMVRKAHLSNIDYGVCLPGMTVAPARGENHKRQCLRALALFGRKPRDGNEQRR